MKIVLSKHDGVVVVRDDLFTYGSKARFLDSLFSSIRQRVVVYGSSPRWGFAQVSVAYLARKYGKKAVLFVAKAKELSSYSRRAQNLGAEVFEVPMGFLSVCESRAREWADQNDGYLLPCGLDTPEVVGEIGRIASSLDINPHDVWTVASSGVLSRGLQLAFSEAKFFAVQVGKKLTKESVGRAVIIESGLPFGKPTKELPPFPSVPEYDAKAWKFIPKDGKKVRLFWNVGA